LVLVQNQNSLLEFESIFSQNTYNLKYSANNENYMKYFTVFGILIVSIFVIGMVSTVDAHPHVTIELMESHSHDVNDENFQEEFILHDFEHVIISIFDFINNILFS